MNRVEKGTKGRVLIVDDEDVIAGTLQEFLAGEGFDVSVAGDLVSALKTAEKFEPELVLCDVQLPGGDGLELVDALLKIRPETLFIMITAYATVENAVAAFQRGAQDYLIKPVLFDELLTKINRLLSVRRLLMENQVLRRQLHGPDDADLLVGDSLPMQAVKTLIRKVAPTRSNVLITGESGTGKELVARSLHALGTDPDAVFLAINCAAIPHDLLENQLFGHVRGAFTGADRDHAGLFVAAGQGTVFLDEIGELPLPTQAKLLRAIETKEVLPVGGTRPLAFKARIVAATNKTLHAEVAAGKFRPDLFYRLNVVTIHLPPLRDRTEDIPLLVEALLLKHVRKLGKSTRPLRPEVLRALVNSPWKGNVRELDNALERAVILSDGPDLALEDFALGQSFGQASPPTASELADNSLEFVGDDLRVAMTEFERRHIRRVLDRCGGDKREAARRLGLGLSSLYRKLEETGGA